MITIKTMAIKTACATLAGFAAVCVGVAGFVGFIGLAVFSIIALDDSRNDALNLELDKMVWVYVLVCVILTLLGVVSRLQPSKPNAEIELVTTCAWVVLWTTAVGVWGTLALDSTVDCTGTPGEYCTDDNLVLAATMYQFAMYTVASLGVVLVGVTAACVIIDTE